MRRRVVILSFMRKMFEQENKLVARLCSLALIILTSACVDRIDIDTDLSQGFPIAVEGFITDQPGPYRVEISKSFDMESKQSLKAPISVRKVVISDDHGQSEELVEISQGVYLTSAAGIRGEIGRAYRLNIQTLDGRVYESIADTLKSSGSVDRVFHEFKEDKDANGTTTYGFDVFFDANAGSASSYYFLWKFKGTFQVDTNPELHVVSCGESKCPDPRPCSSYALINGKLEYVKVCECCSCWVDFFNETPVVSDDQLIRDGKFTKIKATYIPVTQWTFMYKVHAEVQQFTLSRQAFTFWKAVQAQKQAVTSLFQPVTGKVQGNFVQLSGEPGPMEGLFYASAVTSKSIFIQRNDVPSEGMIPPQDLPYAESCMSLFPNSTTQMPDFWD
jgi:hypothetical protein